MSFSSGNPGNIATQRTPFGVSISENGMSETPYVFDDSSKGPFTLWSAARIKNSVQSRKGMEVPNHQVGNITLFGLNDSNVSFDNYSEANPQVLWSSQKMINTFGTVAGDHIPLVPGNTNLAVFSNAGVPARSLNVLDDTSKDANAIWSASKIVSATKALKGMRTGPEKSDNLVAVFDSAGQVVPFFNLPPQTSDETTKIITKSLVNKIPLLTAPKNNLATLNADGTVQDSGSLIDVTKIGKNIIWPNTRVQQAISDMSGAIAAKLSEQKVSAAAAQRLNLGPLPVPSSATKMSLQPSAAANDIAVFDAKGQVVDSKMKLSDAGLSKQDVWSAPKIKQQLDALASTPVESVSNDFTTDLAAIQSAITKDNDGAVLKMSKGPATKNAVAFDSRGSLVDGGFVLDDTLQTTTNVWSALKISNYLAGTTAATQSQLSALNDAAKTLETLLSGKMNLVPSAKAGNGAMFDGAGQLVASTSSFLPASDTRAALALKAGGAGVGTTLATWASPTTLKSSDVSLNDTVFTAKNLLSAAAAAEKTKITLSPYNYMDSNKCFGIYTVANFTHPGPEFTPTGGMNFKQVKFDVVVDKNFTGALPPTRAGVWRQMYFGAITSPVNSWAGVSNQSFVQENVRIPANTVVPHYWTRVIKSWPQTWGWDTIYMTCNPGPVTILFGTYSIVEL